VNTEARTRILLIEDNPDHALIVSRALEQRAPGRYAVVHVERLQEGLERLGEQRFDIVLLDLSLPDSQGLAGIPPLRARAPEVPVIVITASNSEALGEEAVRAGAQDYLVKGEADGRVLARAIRHAIARQQLHEILRGLALRDELTGLYNRRGFVTLAEQHLKLARRNGRGALLVFADVDGFKRVNDRFGHAEGDRALVAVAQVLRSAFRETDIVARVGGDEFAVLAVEAPDASAELLRGRLAERVRAHSERAHLAYEVSVTAGIAALDLQRAAGVDELMAEADRALYALKRAAGQGQAGRP
jgi:diguanylate cyclase (GGDEF)-like protein